MVTISALNKMFSSLYFDLKQTGIEPTKMILFGSYAKGHPRQDSDVDIAIISDGFIGARVLDFEKIKHFLQKV